MTWSFLPSILLRLSSTFTSTHRGLAFFPSAFAFTTSFGSNTSTTNRKIKRLSLLASSSSSSSSSTPSSIRDTTSANTNMSSLSIPDFVKGVKQRLIAEKQQQEQLPHIVIGNAAGDADSIISAITLAYVKTLQQQGQQLIVPIVSILADDLKFLRPETTFLLKDCAGMDNIKDDVNDLIAIDQIDELLPSSKATLTLVDHNYNQRQEQQSQWTVTEIVDHHLDEEKHVDTCPPKQRNIAFENSKALVASCATLVVEQFYNNNNNDDGTTCTTKTNIHPTLAGTYDVHNICVAAAVAVIAVSVVVTTSIVAYHKHFFTLSLSV